MRAMLMSLACSVALGMQPPRDIQRVSQAGGTGAITGVVMSDSSDKGQPRRLRRARVTLNGPDLWVGRTAITDDAGAFRFDRLPPGRYTLSAMKEGYVSMSPGANRPGRSGTGVVLRAGESAQVRFALPRGAVITGSIVNADGEPAPGIPVLALAYRYIPSAGERRLMPVGMVSSPTDDRGVYRIFGLPAGDYVIGAQMRPGGAGSGELQVISPAEVRRALAETRETGARSRPGFQTPPARGLVKEPKPEPRKKVSPAPVYYPGTTVLAAARPVTVAAGEERAGVNFDLEYVPTTTVNGSVGWSGVGVGPAIMFVDSGEGLSNGIVRNTRPDRDGRFTITGVTPGTYTLVARSMVDVQSAAGASSAADWGSTDIIVDGQDELHAAVALQPSLVISGRVAFEGSRARPAFTRGFKVPLPANLQMSGLSLPLPPVVLDADGRFSITGILPGRYRMGNILQGQRTPLGGWWIKSIVVGGRDILDTPLDLRQSADDAVVTLTDQASELTGSAPGAYVIVFSTDSKSWFLNSRRVVGIRPDANQRYTIRNLPAGDYFVAGADDVEPGERYDPEVLQKLGATAARITLGEGEKRLQDVK